MLLLAKYRFFLFNLKMVVDQQFTFDNNTLSIAIKIVKKYQIYRDIMSLRKHIVSAQNTPCLLSKRLV